MAVDPRLLRLFRRQPIENRLHYSPLLLPQLHHLITKTTLATQYFALEVGISRINQQKYNDTTTSCMIRPAQPVRRNPSDLRVKYRPLEY